MRQDWIMQEQFLLDLFGEEAPMFSSSSVYHQEDCPPGPDGFP